MLESGTREQMTANSIDPAAPTTSRQTRLRWPYKLRLHSVIDISIVHLFTATKIGLGGHLPK